MPRVTCASSPKLPCARARGEVRLRVTAVGLCGSDIRWYEEGAIGESRLQRPLVLGHEFAGVIEDGPDAGLRVVADPAVACLACEPCTAGRPNLCSAGRFAGHGATDGALRSAMTWPRRCLHPLPDAIGDAEATLLEPLGVALHAADLARPALGGSAGVFGCGPLGLLLIQVLRAAGTSIVVATDPLAHRRSAAATAGATEVREPAAGPRITASPTAGRRRLRGRRRRWRPRRCDPCRATGWAGRPRRHPVRRQDDIRGRPRPQEGDLDAPVPPDAAR